ncbi:DUF3592 domain-containing protein [Nitrospira moscoviensis]|uniref:DUF3592 domain-containing protein n=1 Tax=Nitrospira moscoviensis TaxID=42253 RepID=A0A0K2G981_NITMO|nr:DUF3592 domain-containing protein [Nitrospira moscoviensis]ALA57495.1 exported protein of unknown function [Nitrospira moscoviensis]
MAGVSLFKTLRRSVLLWVGALFLTAGTVGTFIALQEWRTRQHFERESVRTDATILNKSIEKATRDGNPRTKYQVTYRFAVPGGGTVEQVGEVSVDEWEGLDEGSSFPVRYLPSDPTTTHLDYRDAWWLPLIFAGGGMLFALIGALVASSDLRHVLLVIRLSRGGLPAEGTVQKVWPTSTRINRVTQWRLSYAFRDHMGRTRQGESGLLSPDEAAEWRAGDTGAVRFDRERPQRNIWIGRAGT